MSTLVIPASGKSSRYPNMKPKWLLTHPNGKIMIEMVLNGMGKENVFDRTIITIVKEHAEKFEAVHILTQMLEEKKINAEILVLDDFTSSASETIYETIKLKNIKGPVVIKDSDNYIECNLPKGNFVAGANLTTTKVEVSNVPGKSFIVLDEKNCLIKDIVEKHIKSDTVSLGIYGFEDAELFSEAYRAIEDNQNYTFKNEMYVSHIIAYRIGVNDDIFKYVEVDEYEDWGTLDDWKKVLRKNRTYFIDIDGVILKNSGKYGVSNWKNNRVVLDGNLLEIKKLSDMGAQIFFVTSRDSDSISIVEEVLDKYGINYSDIITGCNHSRRVIINDFANSNPFPSCQAINLPRNGELQNYFEDV